MESNDKPKLIWLDCDPGHDDSFAIMLAAYSSKLRLIGISTVAGNQTIEKTTDNALNVMNLAGLITKPIIGDGESFSPDSNRLRFLKVGLMDSRAYAGMVCPLVQGSPRPLLRPGKICEEIHGDSGLNTHVSLELPEIPSFAKNYVRFINSQSKSRHFTTQIYNYISSLCDNMNDINDMNDTSSRHKITFVCSGPLTNIALLLINHPEAADYIESIVLMGGAMGVGNTGPVSEFNIQVDPEAASYIFESKLPIYMIPLEVTHTVLVDKKVRDRIESSLKSSKFSRVCIELLLYFASTYERVFFMSDPPLHDPCAVAFAIDPSMFEWKLMRVDIETHSHLSYGQTVCDIYGMSDKPKNVHVCTKIDLNRFWSMMFNALVKANEFSPTNF